MGKEEDYLRVPRKDFFPRDISPMLSKAPPVKIFLVLNTWFLSAQWTLAISVNES